MIRISSQHLIHNDLSMIYQCYLKEILCIIRLWDEVIDELGKESCKYFLLKKFTSAEYISGNGIMPLSHYGIATYQRQAQKLLSSHANISSLLNSSHPLCERVRVVL